MMTKTPSAPSLHSRSARCVAATAFALWVACVVAPFGCSKTASGPAAGGPAAAGPAPGAQTQAQHAGEHAGAPARAPSATHASAWTYAGATGPDAWGDLEPAYTTCKDGKSQSPVDLPVAVPAGTSAQIEVHYQRAPLKVVNNGHTIQVDVPAGSYIEIDGTRYDLLQLHFHHPSEHTVGGKPADMVAHLVHASDTRALAVVGVLMNRGDREPAILERIWEHLPAKDETWASAEVRIDPAELLPARRAHYRYQGSLTTPPCTEGVLWTVLAEPITISPAHLDAFHALYPGNARPVQPLNRRAVSGGGV